jgi:hypothetical protein
MAILPTTYRGKRRLKIFGIVVGIIAVVIIGLQIWFVYNAKDILIGIVESKSKGKVKLDLSNVKFNFLSNQLQIREGDLISTDTSTVPTSYHVKFSTLTLKVRSYWPLLLNRSLSLDSINIHNPVIEVLQWRKDTASRKSKDDLSVTQEMGRLYNSMLDVLEGFGIRRIVVNNASLKLVNKMDPASHPVWLTNVYLNVLRKPGEDGHKAKEQSVDLSSTDQSISLPGGRHQLSFKGFKLELFRKRIVLDSCTVTAVPNGISTSSYKIFFHKLSLIGVDFNAMSDLNLIRADSVYCEDPLFDVRLNPSDAVSKKKKDKPDPEKIVRELTSDLDLGFVGVKDAGIHLNIVGKRPRSVFNSHKDNFEMRGLRINGDSASPVSVQRFDMLIRDYHLYNMDSSAVFGFDSIHFTNSKVLLSNFSILTTPSKFKIKSIRDFKFPRFELTGLDWYHLVFNQSVVAKEAVLTNPTIKYTRRTPLTEKKTNFFSTLQNMDSLMTLDRLSIIDGELNLNFGKSTTLDLHKVNLRVSSNELMSATNREGLRKAVDYFSVSNGLLKRKDLTARLINVQYLPNNIVKADKLLVNSATNTVNAEVNDVLIDNMLLDDRTETILVDGIQWNKATVALETSPDKKASGKNKSMSGSFDVKNVQGKNTQLLMNNGITAINSSVQLLKVGVLTRDEGGPVQVSDVHFAGNNLSILSDAKRIKGSVGNIEIDNMLLKDEANNITADGVRWNNAAVDVNSLVASKSEKDNDGSLTVKNVAGLNTKVNISNIDGQVNSDIHLVKAGSLSKIGSNPFVAEALLVKGKTFAIRSKTLKANIDAYQVASDEESFVSQLNVDKITERDSLLVRSQRINFTADINSMLANDFHFIDVQAIMPTINMSKWNTIAAIDTTPSGNASLRIDKLTVTQPEIIIGTHRNDSTTLINIPAAATSGIKASQVVINSAGIQVGSMQVNTDAAVLNSNGKVFGVDSGKVNIELSDLHLQKKDGRSSWGGFIKVLALQNPNSLVMGKNKNRLVLEQASMGNLNLSSENTADINQLFKSNPAAWVHSGNGQYSDSNSVIKWYNAQYNNEGKTLNLDSFSYNPALQRDSAIAKTPYQFDYMTFRSGAISFNGFDLEKYQQDSALVVSSINLKNPVLKVYRDKLKESLPNAHKSLPAESIRKIAGPVSIGKINIQDGEVYYTEKLDKSRAEGTLVFTRITGAVENVKSREHTAIDSVSVALNAHLMDKTIIDFRIKESYTDTALGFRMLLKMKPTEIALLNPVMVPLSNIKVTSGRIDSFELRAIAREHFAVGKMTMFYRDFRIKMISDGDANKSNFKNKMITFLANTFVLKNHNNDREALIFLERFRDKSFFNYLLKITFNGMGNSVGVGSNSKNLKGYKKLTELRGLPISELEQFTIQK